METYLYPVKEG